jgi:hypothetical protein
VTLHNGKVKGSFGEKIIQDIKNTLYVDVIYSISSQIFISDKKGIFCIMTIQKDFATDLL